MFMCGVDQTSRIEITSMYGKRTRSLSVSSRQRSPLLFAPSRVSAGYHVIAVHKDTWARCQALVATHPEFTVTRQDS